VVFATHALSPAKISRVTVLSPLEKHMEVIVDDTQLSLAIGKKGQNVRLAAKLLGWKVDIKSEEEKRQEVESQMSSLVVPGAPVSVLLDHGLTEEVVAKLVEANIATVEKLGSMTPEELESIPEIGPDAVELIQLSVNSYYGQFETAESDTPAEEVVPADEWGQTQHGEQSAAAGSVEQPLEAPPAEEAAPQELNNEVAPVTSDVHTVEFDRIGNAD
jgi:transcription termination/antitermination protein NusA